MSEHRDVDLVARLLKERLQGISYPPPSSESRAMAIAVLQRRMIVERRARRARLTSVIAAAAAVAILAGYAGLHARIKGTQSLAITGEGFGAGVSVAGRAGTRALQTRGPLSPGDRIVTSDAGWGAIDLSTGTHLMLESRSELAIQRADLEQRFVLGRGSVRADVAHLRPGERFIITTVDAEVEVRGTSFRVSIVPTRCAGASQTQVAVYDGLVKVRHGSREFAVARGETWSLGCPEQPEQEEARTAVPAAARHAEPIAKPVIVKPVIVKSAALDTRESPRSVSPAPSAPLRAEATAPAPVPVRAVVPQESVPSESAPRLEPAPRSAAAISLLAIQNQMFSEAEAARRAGDSRKALAAFERLEERYPDGPLAESSMVERLRILKVENPRAAATLARTYLSRFPSGFARAEAQALRDR